MAADRVRVRRALLSVSDKQGLTEVASALAGFGVELVSTGGTARALREAGLDVLDVAQVTGFPEIMDGRVKTLHPAVHGALLGRRDDPAHLAAMEQHGLTGIDLLLVNLYPFQQTVARGADRETVIENIDIGGPAMIRSAAKNHAAVAVLTDTEDYPVVLDEMRAGGGTLGRPLRIRLAAKAFALTAAYDAAIAGWFANDDPEGAAVAGAAAGWTAGEVHFPPVLPLAFTRAEMLRYGENPHQPAALYRAATASRSEGIAGAGQLQGKALSYNNLNDADAALDLVSEFREGPPAVVIVKHANPCGVALAGTLSEAYAQALACDSVSAFGGIIAVNRPLDGDTAAAITQVFTEVVVAPAADDDARAVFAAKKNLRLLVTGALPDPARAGFMLKSVAGGVLVQSRDWGRIAASDLKLVTRRGPSERELADMLFAWAVAKHVKSNAIVYARDGVTAGIGAGQMNRRDSARIAAAKAREAAEIAGWPEPRTIGSAVASDAFFPFADGLLAAAEAGATAVIQPGGSIRDEEVIAAADEAGLAMAFTGMRHFRH